ncbi:MAG: hypothetical protein PHZ19_10850 [Candidatus Thermoplasmatota archaeon]|nr:hypothetical protein [Candidatus Thermoplasmatota archaeon]
MNPQVQVTVGRGPWLPYKPSWQWEVFVKAPGYEYAIVMRGTARTAQAARDAAAEAMPRVKAARAAILTVLDNDDKEVSV